MKKNKILLFLFLLGSLTAFAQKKVEKWGTFELTLHGPQGGNPFIGISLNAAFKHGNEVYKPEGFYDGSGDYKIRFMPDEEGEWTYITYSNLGTLNGIKGSFICTPPLTGDHGPLSVKNTYHFAYADSTRFIPFGTTIYQWCFQPDSLQQETIQTLKHSPFNKVRFLIIPPYSKEYLKGPDKLNNFPFQRDSSGNWNLSRFNPVYFQNIEKCIKELRSIGVQADVTLFNPYDKGWGFEKMNQPTARRFVKYVVARFAAYRNVWWSLANENSFIKWMTDKDWDNLFQLVEKEDPYHHLRSIHNAGRIYNYTLPWVTHVSLQYYNAVRVFGVTPLLRDIYKKPIVYDEINYEGNISSRWGQLTGKQMTYRFWVAYIGGGYATHGESFVNNPWISIGGKLIGKSPARIAFLKKIVDEAPDLNPIDQYYIMNMAGEPGEYYLIYFGKEKPGDWKFILPKKNLKDGMRFKADIIDTWNMTITPVNKVFEVKKLNNYQFADKDGKSIQLPDKLYMALRIKRINK
ncbi:MAG TPA: DUF5060 domain-containing protein [Arachidicoccus soli]|nr:DUF5060 domain-containing protein [Arachidicoccus soli]